MLGFITFLSTPSARRATCVDSVGELPISDFYPRPPQGGRLAECDRCLVVLHISIHALRKEGDAARFANVALNMVFLSTPSARRATGPCCGFGSVTQISIHALRKEGDARSSAASAYSMMISIHALRKEGDDIGPEAIRRRVISIHALRKEGDFIKKALGGE